VVFEVPDDRSAGIIVEEEIRHYNDSEEIIQGIFRGRIAVD
jgi:hypothetical protein